MSRIPLVHIENMTLAQREQFDRFPSNLTRALLLADDRLARVLPELANAVRASALDEKLREGAILRIARLTGSSYERMQHLGQARKAGLSDAEIETIERGDAPGLSESLDAGLAFVEESVASTRVSDATFARVANVLSSRDIVTLLLLIGHYTMVARLLETLQVELDPEPDEFANEH